MNCTQCGTSFGDRDKSCSVCGSVRPSEDAGRWAPADESVPDWTASSSETVIGHPGADEARHYVVPPQPPREPQVPDPSYGRFQPPVVPDAPTAHTPTPTPAPPAPSYDPSWPQAQPQHPLTQQLPAVHPVHVPAAQLVPAAAPPGGLTPVVDGPSALASPSSSSNARPVLIGVGVVVVVLALALGAFVALKGDDEQTAAAPSGPKPVKPATLLDAASEEASAAYEKLDGATQLAQVNQAGTDAEAAGKAVDDLLSEVDLVASPAARTATRAALEETQGVLGAFAQLKGFDGAIPNHWVIISASVDEHADALDDSLDRLAELKAYSPEEDPIDQIEDAQAGLDSSLGSINAKLADWQKQVEAVTADKAARLAALDDYTGAVQPLIDRYSGLRRDFQDFVNSLDDPMSPVYFDDALNFFSSAASDRQSVRQSLAAITALAALTSPHQQLVSVVDTAVGATNDARSGVQQYMYNGYSGCYDDTYDPYLYDEFVEPSYSFLCYKQTPGWQTYMDKSDQITGSWTAAVDTWKQAVDKERAAIEAVPMPARPSV